MLHWNQVPISKRFRDIWLYSACPMQIVIAHARYHVTCNAYAKFGYVFEIPTSTLPIHWHFYWAPMKIKGCLLVWPPMLNAKSSENFVSPDQNWANFGGFGGLGVRGYRKLRFFTPKCTCVRESTSFEPFCVKIRRKKKNPESHRGSHRKDMSQLTQGLNYLSACDPLPWVTWHGACALR